MARKAQLPRGEKSKLIREILAENPRTKVRAIVATLKERGIDVTGHTVYYVKNKWKRNRRKEKREEAMKVGSRAGVPNAADLVIRVKDVAREAGGMNILKQLVDALAH